MKHEKVLLLGASGSMGFEAFKNLWKRRHRYDIVLLLLPTKKEKKMFAPFEKKMGIKSIQNKGVVEGNGFKIVWGNAINYSDVHEACKGIDWCLSTMAFISPAADRDPEKAKSVNVTAIKNVIKAIESQPNGSQHIKLIYTGSVAQTGDRLEKIHMGRVGDPLNPSVFDYYAITKIMGERAVIESNIKHWVSLRLTFIMIPNVFSLLDPILFHQPINTFMENITARDAGRGLINCLDIPDDSNFWRKVYNMSGGPSCRTTFYDFFNKNMEICGLGNIEELTERNWFALRNFHMQYFEDSFILNDYIHHWRDSMNDYYKILKKNRPQYLKLISKIIKHSKTLKKIVQKATYDRLKKLAMEKSGPLYWVNTKNNLRISAFFRDIETYNSIPKWGIDMPSMDPEPEWMRLNHGYQEDKFNLTIEDLNKAALFRGGQCNSIIWNGNMYSKLTWRCAFGHEFSARPFTIIKAGHWCPKCLPPPWNNDEQAKLNPFFAQVWRINHREDENNFYPPDCYLDIVI
ncbi:MAG: NAD-dependent epimerase/dehydratase family protein [Candidatus Lokiarchaeota archaeon]|nr:NAD-dependent epimerase/dehydratase family protein [Candidatus Lokiarchaeota archaeon]